MILVVVCGPPGVGKTTVAEAVADRVDGELFRTDVVRKELFPDPGYGEHETDAVYEAVFRRARAQLQDGQTVVLDGTFHKRKWRSRAREVASSTDVDLRIVRVECEEDIVEERIEQREDDESDADFDVYLYHRDQFDPIAVDHVTVDNSGDLDETTDQLDEHF